jgi:hypothetical protein
MEPVEFSADIVEQLTGKLVVKGRCLAGPIRVGWVFTSIYRFKDVRAPFLERLDEQRVALRIDRIVAYKRELTEIDSGLTAMLELSGSEGSLVQSGMVLGECERQGELS